MTSLGEAAAGAVTRHAAGITAETYVEMWRLKLILRVGRISLERRKLVLIWPTRLLRPVGNMPVRDGEQLPDNIILINNQ